MAVTAPTLDIAGTALQAQVAAAQALVTATPNSAVVYPAYASQLNLLQTELVCHFMMTGWLNAGTNILVAYSPASTDKVGQALALRVSQLQNLYDNAPTAPPGNANGYGSAGWVTVAQNYFQQLYAAQVQLVQHLMDYPGGITAAAMLANLTGVQTDPAGIAYQYIFDSVGYTDADEDD